MAAAVSFHAVVMTHMIRTEEASWISGDCLHKRNKVQLPSFFKLLRLPRRVQLCWMTAVTPNIDFKALKMKQSVLALFTIFHLCLHLKLLHTGLQLCSYVDAAVVLGNVCKENSEIIK